MDLSAVAIILLCWLVASAWVAERLSAGFEDRVWQLVAQILTFVVLLPVPLADELLARPHFEVLCRERAQLTIHMPESLGPATRRRPLKPEPVEGIGLPAYVQTWWVVTEPDRLVVASYDVVQARGGWLARWARGTDADPVTFQGRCLPPDLERRLTPRPQLDNPGQILPGLSGATLG